MTTFLSPLLPLGFSALHVFPLMRRLPLCAFVSSLLIDVWRWSEMWEEDVNQTELLTFTGRAWFLWDHFIRRQITEIIKTKASMYVFMCVWVKWVCLHLVVFERFILKKCKISFKGGHHLYFIFPCSHPSRSLSLSLSVFVYSIILYLYISQQLEDLWHQRWH